MKLLFDTHVLLWVAQGSERSGNDVRELIADAGNELIFSVVSLWEIVMKSDLGRADFEVDPADLRKGLMAARYVELPVEAPHVLSLAGLPRLHRDPFDRLLVAQAIAEDATLVTADRLVTRYPGKIKYV